MEFTPEPLHSAWHQVRKGSRSPGIDGITVDLFAGVAQHQLEILLRQLQQESYFPRPAKGFYLPKASGGKRLIGIPTVRDRVVQRFLLSELYWPLEDVFLDCSYAYRPGRGIQMAVKHLYSYYRFGNAWVVKGDIEKFFDNLCWPLLLADLEKLQLEPILRQLIEQQLASGIVVKGQSFYPKQGVLQGAILSGALANLYLNEFDRLCLSHGFNLVRFGDDFVVACADSIQANRCLEQISSWLGSLYLKLQPEKTRIFAPDEEFTFLGYLFRDGEVFAPEPPQPSLGKGALSTVVPPLGKGGLSTVVPPLSKGGLGGVLRASGTSFFRPATRKAPVFSGKPLACSISVKRIILPRANSEHFWREPMSTLYITDQGAYLSVQNQQFQVYSQQELRIKVPVSRVSHIILFGCCNLSHGAVSAALHQRIPILYLSQRGRYFGRLQCDGRAKVEYLTKQVICSMNPEFVRRQGEAIVRAKLHNSRILLMRLNRYRKGKDVSQASILPAIEMLEKLMESLQLADSMDALRGYEGKAATVYFQALGSLFSGPFVFEVRTKRPPTDPINSLLSLGYTLLSQNVSSFVEASGLHSHFGNLHVPRDNHPALVSDLMEEFRAQVVDSLVTYLVNKKIFVAEDFTPPDERGGVFLQPHALKKFLKHWDDKLLSETTHPHTGYKVAYRRCLELQVREYISALMGDVEVYRPMIWDK